MSTPTPPEGPPGWKPPTSDAPPAGAFPPPGTGAPYGGAPSAGGPGYGTPPAYGQPAYGPPGYGYPPARPNHPQAVTALVLGIVAWAICPICGIPAVVIGRRVQKEIDANPGVYEGRGMAMAGWIIGAAIVAIWVAVIVIVIVAVLLAAGTASTS